MHRVNQTFLYGNPSNFKLVQNVGNYIYMGSTKLLSRVVDFLSLKIKDVETCSFIFLIKFVCP